MHADAKLKNNSAKLDSLNTGVPSSGVTTNFTALSETTPRTVAQRTKALVPTLGKRAGSNPHNGRHFLIDFGTGTHQHNDKWGATIGSGLRLWILP